MEAFVDMFEEENEERQRIRRGQSLLRAELRDLNNAFDMGDETFRQYYRMYPRTAVDLIEMLRPHLAAPPRGIQPHTKVLTALRFLAEGGYQKGVGNDMNHPMAQGTVSKSLHEVIPTILQLRDRFIVFPRTREERAAVAQR